MNSITALLLTAATIGITHTIIGIDHYVPFVALSKANKWSMKKTSLIVTVCGLGHVLSSVLLGFLGIWLSTNLSVLVNIESSRGTMAAYFLIAFGLVYMIYGIRKSIKTKGHDYSEIEEKANEKSSRKDKVVWGLFILFALGPCEPLIPLLMYPAVALNTGVLMAVTGVFLVCTLSMMQVMTFIGVKGLSLLKVRGLERHVHTLAGSALLISGLLVQFAGI